jgi:hypothetical protein
MNLEQLEAHEEGLIAQFASHEVLRRINELPEERIRQILLQDRFRSLAFAPLGDVVLDHLEDERGRAAVRLLLAEEYPPGQPTHREGLFADLQGVGLSRQQILSNAPSPATLAHLQGLFELLRPGTTRRLNEVRALTLLRLWGEVLTAVEFGRYLAPLARLGVPPEKSQFFFPHYGHDLKRKPLHLAVHGGSHSDTLAGVLLGLLDSAAAIQHCATVGEQVLHLQKRYYDQFIQDIA